MRLTPYVSSVNVVTPFVISSYIIHRLLDDMCSESVGGNHWSVDQHVASTG